MVSAGSNGLGKQLESHTLRGISQPLKLKTHGLSMDFSDEEVKNEQENFSAKQYQTQACSRLS
jgi:hypothetical protein